MTAPARTSTAAPAIVLSKPRAYFVASKAPRYSLLFALPLLLAYEGLGAFLSSVPGAGRGADIRNGADVLLKGAFVQFVGPHGPTIFMAAVIGLSLWLVTRDVKKSGQGIKPSIFVGMLAESSALALLFGLVVSTLTVKLLGSLHMLAIPPLSLPQPISQLGWSTKLMLSLGAGLYEELLFRVLLVSALAAGARIVLGFGRTGAGVVATVVGALIFSAFHYIGKYGDPFTLQSFVFRAISGVAFSALYLTRGFGITAWTHALYDAFLLLQ